MWEIEFWGGGVKLNGFKELFCCNEKKGFIKSYQKIEIKWDGSTDSASEMANENSDWKTRPENESSMNPNQNLVVPFIDVGWKENSHEMNELKRKIIVCLHFMIYNNYESFHWAED